MKTQTDNDVRTDAKNHDAQTDDGLKWRYQDKAYNEGFKKWRRKKQDSIGFYFVDKSDRITYQDRVGFIKDHPEPHEAKAFQRVLAILGFVLIYRAAIDIVSMYLIPPLLEKMGFDIYYSMFFRQRFGSRSIMIAVDLIPQILGRIVPTAILIKYLEMPVSVMLPTKVTNKPMFAFSVPVVLLVAGVCSVMSFFYNRLLTLCNIDATHADMMLGSADNNIIYIIFIQILIIPIISELCTHGVILQLVRQFGDGTALFITTIIITVSTYDVTRVPFAVVTSLVIGYFIIRTGSVVTGVIMRIAVRIYAYVLSFLDYGIDSDFSDTLVMLFILVTILLGLVSTVFFLDKYSDSFAMTIKRGYMSFGRKILAAATSTPIIIWFTLTFLITAFNVKFNF